MPNRQFVRKVKLFYFRLKITSAFWVDKKGNFLKAKEISDEYLKNIIYTVCEKRGWNRFIENKKRINLIFEEAYKRNLYRCDEILSLHQAALYIWGFDDNAPKYIRSWDGKMIDYSDFILGKIV